VAVTVAFTVAGHRSTEAGYDRRRPNLRTAVDLARPHDRRDHWVVGRVHRLRGDVPHGPIEVNELDVQPHGLLLRELEVSKAERQVIIDRDAPSSSGDSGR
jgi:hypothetical protein